jgi:hypothetical protein
MEPIVTPERYKVQQNPEESRSLLGDYYERRGFYVVLGPEVAARSKNSLATPVTEDTGTFGAIDAVRPLRKHRRLSDGCERTTAPTPGYREPSA